MLTSLILNLKSPTSAELPANLGRAAHALFLQLLNDFDPALAANLHNLNGLKPFTISNLVMGRRKKGAVQLEAEQEGWLRFTGLTEGVSRFLIHLAENPPQRVELDRFVFGVSGAALNADAHPWANAVNYQDFAAPFLLGGQDRPSPRLKLEFASPTTFRSGSRYIPFPLPEQVFGSLLNKWQTFAPVALNPEIKRFAREMVAAQQYRLRTRAMPYKREARRQGDGGTRRKGDRRGNMQIGFVGQVTFTVMNRDRYWLNMLHLLGAYAFYSGVGYQTTAGLGQVRMGE